MIERLRMQEVEEIILSVPEGVTIAGTNLKYGEPVMIIKNPQLSTLQFNTTSKKIADRGDLGSPNQISRLDFTINEGSISYAVWTYLHGILENNTSSKIKGTEYVETDDEHKILLSAHTTISNLIVYKNVDGVLTKLYPQTDYEAYYTTVEGVINNYVEIIGTDNKNYFICYDYVINGVDVSTIKQISNNIICSLDIYFDALDIDNDEHKKVVLHCDRAQVFSDLAISINDSSKASFNPITINAIAEQNDKGDLNKTIATLTVI